jgi:hypothetical protein
MDTYVLIFSAMRAVFFGGSDSLSLSDQVNKNSI